VRFGGNLSWETSRLLAQLRRGVLPAPAPQRASEPAERPEGRESLETRESGEGPDRESDDSFGAENDAGFISRFETFEAAVGPDWSPLQAARTLCRVLRLKAEWITALDEGWLDENLDLKRLLAKHRAAPASAEKKPEKDNLRAPANAPPPWWRKVSPDRPPSRRDLLLASTAPIVPPPPPRWRGLHPPPDIPALPWQEAA
jgi:hypothetical protein